MNEKEKDWVQGCVLLLDRMIEEHREIVEKLNPAGQDQVQAKLVNLIDQADRMQTEAGDLLWVANAVYQLVGETPALADFLPEKTDLAATQPERGLTGSEYDMSSDAQYVHEKMARIRHQLNELRRLIVADSSSTQVHTVVTALEVDELRSVLASYAAERMPLTYPKRISVRKTLNSILSE